MIRKKKEIKTLLYRTMLMGAKTFKDIQIYFWRHWFSCLTTWNKELKN